MCVISHSRYIHVSSPLASRVIDLVALAAADGDGVEGLEGAQAHPGDGHVGGGEHEQDSLGVVEGHRQVVADGDHQRVGAAAEKPLACTEGSRGEYEEEWQGGKEARGSSREYWVPSQWGIEPSTYHLSQVRHSVARPLRW